MSHHDALTELMSLKIGIRSRISIRLKDNDNDKDKDKEAMGEVTMKRFWRVVATFIFLLNSTTVFAESFTTYAPPKKIKAKVSNLAEPEAVMLRARIKSALAQIGLHAINRGLPLRGTAQMIGTNADFSQRVLLILNLSLPEKYMNKFYSVRDLWIYHTKVKGVGLGFATYGLDSRRALAFVKALQSQEKSAKIERIPTLRAHAVGSLAVFFNGFVGVAQASDAVTPSRGVAPQNTETGSGADGDGYTVENLVDATLGCTKGVVESLVVEPYDFFVARPTQAIRFIYENGMAATWEAAQREFETIVRSAQDFSASKMWSAFKSLPQAEQTRITCGLAAFTGPGAAVGVASKTGGVGKADDVAKLADVDGAKLPTGAGGRAGEAALSAATQSSLTTRVAASVTAGVARVKEMFDAPLGDPLNLKVSTEKELIRYVGRPIAKNLEHPRVAFVDQAQVIPGNLPEPAKTFLQERPGIQLDIHKGDGEALYAWARSGSPKSNTNVFATAVDPRVSFRIGTEKTEVNLYANGLENANYLWHQVDKLKRMNLLPEYVTQGEGLMASRFFIPTARLPDFALALERNQIALY